MQKNKQTQRLCLLIAFWAMIVLTIAACSKDEGKGGRALITGKLYVRDYNSSGILKGEFYGPDEDVFIIYGDEPTYGDVVKTHYDGTFRFEYLRKGNYTVFAYSDCDTCASETQPIMLETEITSSKQVVELPDLVVRR